MQVRGASVWSKINEKEIELKLLDLVAQLRGENDEHINAAISKYSSGPTSERERRRNAFLGITRSGGKRMKEGA